MIENTELSYQNMSLDEGAALKGDGILRIWPENWRYKVRFSDGQQTIIIGSMKMIGLSTTKSVKPSYYQTRGRRRRVGDMTVSHD